MKIVVIGLGSMGRRRIRLLRKINSGIEIAGVDSNTARCTAAEEEFHIRTSHDLNSILQGRQIDAAVISTSPQYHAKLIQQCLNENLHVFTELNLLPDLYATNVELAKRNGKTLFLSSTFLYREEIKYLRSQILKNNQKLNYSYHVGQYLPDWHPWENYKNYFVGESRTNACREIFAIELPWLRKTFGDITSFEVVRRKSTLLDIDYFDTYHLILTHTSGTVGSLLVDVVSRKAVRNLEVYGENLYVSWDGSPLGLKEYDFNNKCEKNITLYKDIDKLQEYSGFVIENAYQSELQCFLDEICGQCRAEYSFDDDLITLKLIDEIEGKQNG